MHTWHPSPVLVLTLLWLTLTVAATYHILHVYHFAATCAAGKYTINPYNFDFKLQVWEWVCIIHTNKIFWTTGRSGVGSHAQSLNATQSRVSRLAEKSTDKSQPTISHTVSVQGSAWRWKDKKSITRLIATTLNRLCHIQPQQCTKSTMHQLISYQHATSRHLWIRDPAPVCDRLSSSALTMPETPSGVCIP